MEIYLGQESIGVENLEWMHFETYKVNFGLEDPDVHLSTFRCIFRYSVERLGFRNEE